MNEQMMTNVFFDKWGKDIIYSENSEEGWGDFERNILENKVILADDNKLLVSTYCANDESTYIIKNPPFN